MKRLIMFACLCVLPIGTHAQDLRIDPSQVRACFANTPVGAVYPECLGVASNTCQGLPGGSSTVGIATCITAETTEWDAILNEEYKATQALNAESDATGASPILDRTEALRDAQRAWIAFRDADCAARFAQWQEGTMRTLVSANCHLTMTASRAIDLRDMRGM